jgi:hypothetical protein
MLKNELRFIISFFLLLNSCGTVKAPHGSVPKRNALMTDAFGGWIELRLISPENFIAGEFIAIRDDSLYILTGGEIQKYAIPNVSSARVVLFKTESDSYGIWTFFGSLLTLSNGGFAVITLPSTLISGISTTVVEAKRINFLDYPSNNFDELKKFARFPQGMPEGINTTDLIPRPSLKQ